MERKMRFRHHKRCYITMVEYILGKPIPKGAVIHHINGNRDDNRPRNLVLCQNQAYHMLIHLRMRSMESTGSPNFRTCKYCKKWEKLVNLSTAHNAKMYWHSDCHNEAQKEVYLDRREKVRKQQQEYYQKNREKILAYKKLHKRSKQL